MQIIVCFANKLLMTWDELPQELIRNLFISFGKSLRACINVEGRPSRLTKMV